MITKGQANELLIKAKEMIRELGYESIYPIKSDLRFYPATSYFGQVRRKLNGVGSYFEITISTYHLQHGEEAVLNTLVHEVIHTVEGCFNHGTNFKKLAKIVNERYGLEIARVGGGEYSLPDNKPVYKYKIKCQSCGTTFLRQRKSKLVTETDHYLCGHCHGKLELL